MVMDYTVIIEGIEGEGFSAFSPDIPGVVATGETEAEVRERMASGIAFHLGMLRQAGDEIPRPTTTAYVQHIEL